MYQATRALEDAAWAAAEGTATTDQLAQLEADPRGWRLTLERLLDETEDQLDAVRHLSGPERDQVVADFEEELARLDAAYDLLTKVVDPVAAIAAVAAADPSGEVRLQASWESGQVVVWAAGPDTAPAHNGQLADRLEAIGGPELGWTVHSDVVLPSGARAAALSIPVEQSLGWLVAVGGGLGGAGVGASVTWLGRVAVEAVRLVARGSVVPSLRGTKRPNGKTLDLAVRWNPALVDARLLDELTAAMPGAIAVLAPADAKATTLEVLGAVVDAIVREAAGRLTLPAPPPTTHTTPAVAEAFITRLDGSAFDAPVAAGAEVSKRLDRWAKPVLGPARSRLVVQLDPPDSGNAWFLSVLGPGAEGNLLPVEQALTDSRATTPLADDLTRLERILPALLRPGGMRRGQVYLSQTEAWELMTVTGTSLEAAGFEARVPVLSRRKPSPGLRMFTEPTGDSVVGAHQLSNVRWSAVFDDVELSAADIAKLAAEARPLVRSRGRWVELDRADLKEAAAALAERSQRTQLTGAEILRHAVGLEGVGLAGGVVVDGSGWASELLQKAGEASADPVTNPEGFIGELRGYQAEALGWLGFLDAVELGGCLALDMGLGKTPTMLAHLARTVDRGAALVIAPPAVVGNWAAEAAKFTPQMRVVVHHGASRASAEQLGAEVASADVVITTYGTAVRDVDALAATTWSRVVLDEAQAIKNPANETAQLLRRIPSPSRIALTGTPIENGLGDLWAILDYTNPGLVGSRPAFISQLSGEGEAALRALNGILVFRRTKSEPIVAAELPDRIDELDHCTMTPEQIGLYQAVLDGLVVNTAEAGGEPKQGAILAAITALKQICNHPANYQDDGRPLAGRSGKLARLEEIVESVFAAGERILVFTHFAEWGKKLADHLTEVTGVPIACYHGGLARGARDRLVEEFQQGEGPGALVLSLKAGGTGLNLTAASHVVLYDRWWNPAVEDQARDRAWRIGQTRTVVSHRLVCPGTVDERVEEVVAGKRHIADLVLPKSSSLSDLDADQLRVALGLRPDTLLTEEDT
ncbi:MAG: SNF2-related protein [Acidimicrobiales bacterium]|nr:SNF2-related protein [Acidimicrobiales bacterium]